jgi:menaquinone-9 beta-reductase
MEKFDVIIVGGGPAGASCAWRLRRHNIDCLILDRAPFPREKLCAGWITPDVLADLGMRPEDYPHGLRKLRSMRVRIRRVPIHVPTHQYSIRRYEFDHWLLLRSGAPVETHFVREIRSSKSEFVIDGRYSARYLVGAGGTGCPVYRTFFKESGLRDQQCLIVTQEEEFEYDYSDPNCYLWFMENKLSGYAWYVPKANGYINIGIGGKATSLRRNHDSIKRHWDILITRLEKKRMVVGHTWNPKGHSYYLRNGGGTLRRGNAFLIGDAAGLATVDMGEGIGPAIRSGIHAADAIALGKEYTLEGIARYSIRSKFLQTVIPYGVRLFQRSR